ncbi:hypothetical protein MAGR_20920 [Mycolicibacterium agri]|uniref:Uncharacterized protein n=1 Tax=Mycolicibacterium agri TaxID=36811 RepID=A0A7I9VYX7_MYCAG|nr:hypothetical protein MAGR_20920 [Mycolicibacterium agri]
MQADGQIGFYWATPTGEPASLPELMLTDDEPERLLATHLEALDDAMIIAAAQFGEILGGGRQPDPAERDDLLTLHRTLDILCRQYALGAELSSSVPNLRAGKIIGTAALLSIKAREPLGLLGQAPLDDRLDPPPQGVVSGFGQLQLVDQDKPWMGGRWVLKTEAGQRHPLTLSMMMFDSSGVNKNAARQEHRDLLRTCIDAAGADVDPFTLACALDWLLYDWLMAHRADPDSAEIEIPKGSEADAIMIVDATAASMRTRARFDPGLTGALIGRP